MIRCQLPYIPERLHSYGKKNIPKFSIGEELYYRCNSSECLKPYQAISLYDISHNRNFNNKINFPKEDVLWNIDENSPHKIIENKEINISIIKSISKNGTFEKNIVSDLDPSLHIQIKLIHSPLPCMYSHSSFQISLNDTIVTRQNYSEILDKRNKTYKNLRRDIRLELTSIIYSSGLDNNSETEIITDL